MSALDPLVRPLPPPVGGTRAAADGRAIDDAPPVDSAGESLPVELNGSAILRMAGHWNDGDGTSSDGDGDAHASVEDQLGIMS